MTKYKIRILTSEPIWFWKQVSLYEILKHLVIESNNFQFSEGLAIRIEYCRLFQGLPKAFTLNLHVVSLDHRVLYDLASLPTCSQCVLPPSHMHLLTVLGWSQLFLPLAHLHFLFSLPGTSPASIPRLRLTLFPTLRLCLCCSFLSWNTPPSVTSSRKCSWIPFDVILFRLCSCNTLGLFSSYTLLRWLLFMFMFPWGQRPYLIRLVPMRSTWCGLEPMLHKR